MVKPKKEQGLLELEALENHYKELSVPYVGKAL